MEVPVHGVVRQSDGRSKVALIEGTRWVSNDRDMVEGFGRNEEGLRPGAPFQFGRQVQLTSGAFNFLQQQKKIRPDILHIAHMHLDRQRLST